MKGVVVLAAGLLITGVVKDASPKNGNWTVTVNVPECGAGDVLGQPIHHMFVIYPERSGDVLTVVCSNLPVKYLNSLNIDDSHWVSPISNGLDTRIGLTPLAGLHQSTDFNNLEQ